MSGHIVVIELPVAHSCRLLKHLNSFHREMFKLNTKFDADSLPYLLSHFECDDHHIVHIFTQWHLPPLLTSNSEVSSLFTHVHSSPLFLVARLHGYCTYLSHYINNGNSGWTFSQQTSYTDQPCIIKMVHLVALQSLDIVRLLHFVISLNEE